jgi:uncharacterized membrane protein YhaH (DUF805 family)
MKGSVLIYDDNTGAGQISGDDGVRYSFTRSDLKQLVPVGKGTRVDFDFEGKTAHDIYVEQHQAGRGGSAATPYFGEIEPDLGLWGYFTRALTAYYARFSGRARRKEFWGFYLFTTILWLVIAVVAGGIIAAAASQSRGAPNWVAFAPALLLIIPLLALIIPSLAITFRRFHDIGQSGWIVILLYALSLIPYVGFVTGIIIIVMCCLDSQPGENKYGPPVK